MVLQAREMERVRREQQPVVALESTVIAHGLPAPHNLATALACEAEVGAAGAVAMTIAIVDGQPRLGLSEAELREIAGRRDVVKVNPANLAGVMARRGWGATTVAASLHLAAQAGIRVFATGGIGGVHRGLEQRLDISADLTALARYPVITVCAGAKAILDLPRTREVLETLGVPVIGYQTDEFPAFYSRQSGLGVDWRVETPAEVVEIAECHWGLGFKGGLLVVVPVPLADEIPAIELEEVITEALVVAADSGESGKSVTPFLLKRIAERTGGRVLDANIALLRQNARVAGQIAATAFHRGD